jgi:hypothetical protein
MANVKAIILLPLKDNDGRKLASEIKEFRNEVFDRFDGWTREGTVTGSFRMPDGTEKLDVCAKYMVVVDESRISELEQVLADFKKKTLQEKIYVEIQREVDIRLI